jgi:hypothetical protein
MSSHLNTSGKTGECAMESYPLSHHASIRVQQRGVNREVLDCLLAYGRHAHDHQGSQVVTFDGKSLDALALDEPQSVKNRATDSRNLYAVLSADGVVITAGYRFRRIPRDLSLSANRPGRSRRPRVLNGPSNPYRI